MFSDGFVFAYDQKRERRVGLGHRSPVFDLGLMEIALSQATATLLGKEEGDRLTIKFALEDMLNQKNFMNKF